MNSTFFFLTISLLSALISAVPIKQHVNSTLGATYFITNKANNTVIVSSIGQDGTLSFAREIPTGGKGGSASGGADALFSQDSIIQNGGVHIPFSTELNLEYFCSESWR
jgi:hypothetical protein